MSHRSSTLVLLLLVVFLNVSQLAMPPIRHAFTCIRECSRGFHSQRGLSLHQSGCSVFQVHQYQQMLALAQASAAQESYLIPVVATPSTEMVRE